MFQTKHENRQSHGGRKKRHAFHPVLYNLTCQSSHRMITVHQQEISNIKFWTHQTSLFYDKVYFT